MNIGEYKTQLAALKSSATNALVGGIVLGVMAFAALLAKNIGIFLFSCVLAAALLPFSHFFLRPLVQLAQHTDFFVYVHQCSLLG